ncbi:selenocysteine-specific translation elongation factor [Blastococcus brunescens]|uniref:Selenocysteine-specific translation elongation factor n=1 Tax=Blastococcus brunescens TaxID=1564165 RepID=A0ABZ1B7Y3_9ACTN|nr:selenocysteine-specific translation elongation factor [Blastococcus sp. BMG 8361]WRL66896.1 selenocysteine-specific translation elongation factor [Blastococcus sp. BMG 8361]
MTPPETEQSDVNHMDVIATAGHVDHGKSALVRALTGMEPDRWAEERRRGLTIDLGFAWTTLRSGRRVAVVDVPGHEKFVGNMLAGVGPVPTALLVVAADDGWSAQTAEHVAVLDALGVRHALLAVTKSDLADPAPVVADVRERLAATSMGDVPAVAVSSVTGDGIRDLGTALEALLVGLPPADPSAPVRLWIDRAFTIRGAGTVVTGTLAAGSVAAGDRLVLGGRDVVVRRVQSLGAPVERATAVARVALNLRDVAVEALSRGDVLLTPDAFRSTELVDVALDGEQGSGCRPNRWCTSDPRPSPPGCGRSRARWSACGWARPCRCAWGPAPAPRSRRSKGSRGRRPGRRPAGAAATRGGARAGRGHGRPATGAAGAAVDLARRRIVRTEDFTAMGWPIPEGASLHGGWLMAAGLQDDLAARVPDVVVRYRRLRPLEPGPPVEVVRRALDLPDAELVAAVVRPPLELRAGRVVDAAAELPPEVQRAVDEIRARLAQDPFAALEAPDLVAAGLGVRELAAAVRSGQLVRIGDGVYLAPTIAEVARARLASIEQPFTLSQARQAWGTSRRVAVPLAEWLDAQAVTVRLPDNTRRLR